MRLEQSRLEWHGLGAYASVGLFQGGDVVRKGVHRVRVGLLEPSLQTRDGYLETVEPQRDRPTRRGERMPVSISER